MLGQKQETGHMRLGWAQNRTHESREMEVHCSHKILNVMLGQKQDTWGRAGHRTEGMILEKWKCTVHIRYWMLPADVMLGQKQETGHEVSHIPKPARPTKTSHFDDRDSVELATNWQIYYSPNDDPWVGSFLCFCYYRILCTLMSKFLSTKDWQHNSTLYMNCWLILRWYSPDYVSQFCF